MTNPSPDTLGVPYPTASSFTRQVFPSMGETTPHHDAPPPAGPPNRLPTPQVAAAERGTEESLPRPVDFAGSGVMPATGALFIRVGQVSPGWMMEVKRLNVGPPDYTVLPYATGVTVLAARQPFSQGGGAPSVGYDMSAMSVASQVTTWPAEATWGRFEFLLVGGQSLVVVVIGLTAGLPVSVGGQGIMQALGRGGIMVQ